MRSRKASPSLAAQNLELRALHEALELSNRKYKNLFEFAPVGYLFLDPDGHVEEANLAAADLFGQPRSLLGGSHVNLLTREEDRAALQRHLARVGVGEADSLEVRVLRSDGQQVPVSIRSMAMLDAAGDVAGVQMTLMDISAHKKAETELRQAKDFLHHLAHHDVLTDLPNRLLFGDRLRQALLRAKRRKGRVGLLFIDVDRFKFINDSLGHQMGDEFLCELARRILGSVRAVDTVARIGGDEFTVILERIEAPQDGLDVGRKILDALRAPIALGEHEVQVTSSVGVATYPDDGLDLNDLVRRADAAMFAAKAGGRDRVRCFTAALDEQGSNRVVVKSKPRSAVKGEQLRLRIGGDLQHP